MAEWLGTALQKLLQRFESASDLQERLTFLSVVFCFLRCGFSSPTHPKKQRRVGASPIVLLFLCGCMQPAKNTLRALLTLKEGCGDSCVDGSLGSPKEVSPRVRAKALTSNLASDLQKRLTVLSVVFCFFLWYAGWRGAMAPLSRATQPPCASPRGCLPAPQQADAPPQLFAPCSP